MIKRDQELMEFLRAILTDKSFEHEGKRRTFSRKISKDTLFFQ